MYNIWRLHRPQSTRLLCPWNSPGKNTGMGCHFLLQGIFPTQGSNQGLLCLLYLQEGSLPLVPPGKSKPGVSNPFLPLRQRACNLGWSPETASATVNGPRNEHYSKIGGPFNPREKAYLFLTLVPDLEVLLFSHYFKSSDFLSILPINPFVVLAVVQFSLSPFLLLTREGKTP